MENKETLDTDTPISYANGHFKVVPINDKVATVRPASAGEVLKWRSSIKDEPSERSTMVVLPIMIRNGVYKFVSNSWSEVFNSWSELYAYAVSQVNVDLVYDEFVEAVREALPECSAVIDGTKEALEGKDDYPETLESSSIELSEDEIKIEVSEDVDGLIIQLVDIATNETISEVLSLINNTCNKKHDVLSIDWEIVELEAVFRLDLMFEIVKWGSKKPGILKTMSFFPLINCIYD